MLNINCVSFEKKYCIVYLKFTKDLDLKASYHHQTNKQTKNANYVIWWSSLVVQGSKGSKPCLLSLLHRPTDSSPLSNLERPLLSARLSSKPHVLSEEGKAIPSQCTWVRLQQEVNWARRLARGGKWEETLPLWRVARPPLQTPEEDGSAPDTRGGRLRGCVNTAKVWWKPHRRVSG